MLGTAEQILRRSNNIQSTQVTRGIDACNELLFVSEEEICKDIINTDQENDDTNNYLDHLLRNYAYTNNTLIFALAACLNHATPMTNLSIGTNTPVIENISAQSSTNLASLSIQLELTKKKSNASRLKASKEKLGALKYLLTENLRGKNKEYILNDKELSSKIDEALTEISKLNYDRAAVELTVFKILNVSLKIDLKNLFVKIGIPLINNVEDLPSGEVLYTYARNNQIVDSENTTLCEMAEEINRLG